MKTPLITLACLILPLSFPSFGHSDKQGQHQVRSKQAWISVQRKPMGSDIALRYRFANAKPFYTVGETVTIELEFTGANGKDSAMELRHDAGLLTVQKSLNSAGLSKTANGHGRALPADKHSTSISLTPSSEGLHYVHVQTSQDGKGSVAAIPVRVGNKPLNLPTTGEVKTLPDGRKIIEMKAN